jgi:hypothetical protein
MQAETGIGQGSGVPVEGGRGSVEGLGILWVASLSSITSCTSGPSGTAASIFLRKSRNPVAR